MKKVVKNGTEVYLRQQNQRVTVSEDFKHEYNKPIDAYRKKAQYHGKCMCPKIANWKCDMDCWTCPYIATGDTLSLEFESQIGDGHFSSFGEKLVDETANLQAIVEDSELLTKLAEEIAKLSDFHQEICELWKEEHTIREIAGIVGKSKSTVGVELKKAFALLRTALEEYR